MLPVLALLLTGWLLTESWRARGPQLTLHFAQGHGLSAGAALRYRGIDVGEVENLSLDDRLGGVRVTLRLSPQASDLARAGSRFWIVRPQLDVTGVRGLDTLVGARYIGVAPGDPAAAAHFEFVGLEQPPPLELIEPGGLEIVLSAPGKGNLRPGAPISYRQVIIGSVITVDLARDAAAVEARVYVRPDYTNLIRRQVRFWRTGGARVSAGLGGLSVAVDSVHSLILGGINMAIPPQPGARVVSGARFVLHDEPRGEWLEWTPGLSMYSETDAAERTRRPQLITATRRWRYRNWAYLTQDGERRGWLLPLDDALLGPSDVLIAGDDVIDDSSRLRIAGELVAPGDAAAPLARAPRLARLARDHDYPPWPSSRRRFISAAEDALVIAGDDLTPRFVGADRFQDIPGEATASDAELAPWPIDPALPFGPDWHGAAVIAESDGALLGLLRVDDGAARLWRLPPDPSPPAAADASAADAR